MKTIVLTPLFIILTFSLFSQNNNPHVDIKVNKQYDENGNIIQYDSTYTYYYSSDGNIPDSVNFNFNFPNNSLFVDPFSDMKFNIPLTFEEFFNNDNLFNDPFFNEFNSNYDKLIEDLKQRLDSIYYNNQNSTEPIDEKKEYTY